MCEIKSHRMYQRGETWYIDVTLHNGEHIRKSLQTTKSGLAKAKSLDVLAEIEQSSKYVPTFSDFATGFFDPGSPWLTRRAAMGYTIKESTRAQYAALCVKFLIPKFGPREVGSIRGAEIEEFALSLSTSNSHKNYLLATAKAILDEAARAGLRSERVVVDRFKRDSERKGVFTQGELDKLFPEDPAALAQVWRSSSAFARPEVESVGLVVGTMYALMVSAGLRSGEVRALEPKHLLLDRNAIAIVQAFDIAGDVVLPKKADERNTKARVVLIPDRTKKMLQRIVPEYSGQYVFEFYGQPLKRRFTLERFRVGLANAGILPGDRKLSPHALRYTYNTRMQQLINPEVLRQMIGHESSEMTSHYTQVIIDERVQALTGHQNSIDQFWR